jgi:hypothetical protein
MVPPLGNQGKAEAAEAAEAAAEAAEAAAEAAAAEHQVKFPNRKRCLNLHNRIFEPLDMRNAILNSQVLSSRDLYRMCR